MVRFLVLHMYLTLAATQLGAVLLQATAILLDFILYGQIILITTLLLL